MLPRVYNGVFMVQMSSGFKVSLVFFLAFLLGSVGGVYAQLKDIMPVSPEAAALAKMVNYDVNLNTGIPQISIPLYKVESGGFTIPLGLSYHAGGFKVNERSTRVGLGWSLDCEPQITRAIDGRDDLLASGYIHNTLMKAYNCTGCDYPLESDFRNSYRLATGEHDGAPDRFNYKLMTKSGSFFFQKSQDGNSYTIVPVPYDNIKITYNNTNLQFTIVDTDGTIYEFGSGLTGNQLNDYLDAGMEMSGGGGSACLDCHVTAWKCMKVTNLATTQTLTFVYERKSVENFRGNADYVELYNNSEPCDLDHYWRPEKITRLKPAVGSSYEALVAAIPFYELSSPKYIVSVRNKLALHMPDYNSEGTVQQLKRYTASPAVVPTSSVRGLALSQIKFPGGTIDFTGADRLQQITVRNLQGAEVRSFSFFHEQLQGTINQAAKTLYLDSIQMKAGADVFERYLLVYKKKFAFGDHLIGQDAWGYTNDKTKEYMDDPSAPYQTSVPTQELRQPFQLDLEGGCGNRIEDAAFTIGGDGEGRAERPRESVVAYNGMLHRIVYPTGGYVDFDFESNRYEEWITAYGSSDAYKLAVIGGGIRIKSINYYDNTSGAPVMQKSYTYGELENGVGQLLNKPQRNYSNAQREYDAFQYTQTMAYITGPDDIPGSSDGVFYPIPQNCRERSCLELRAYDTKTTYLPASGMDYTYSNGAPIYYDHVTEYQMDLGQTTGKKVYTYYPADRYGWIYDTNVIPNTNINRILSDGLIGHLQKVEDFKMEKGRFVPVHKKEYTYYKHQQTLMPRVVYAFFNVIYRTIGGNFTGNAFDLYDNSQSFGGGGLGQDDFTQGEYGIEVARVLLQTETETYTDVNNQAFITTTRYAYGRLPYLNPTSIEVSNSKGEKTLTSLLYPFDFHGVYDGMVAANMVTPVVETWVENMVTHEELSRVRTNYAEIVKEKNFFAPVSVEKSFDGEDLEVETSLTAYDKMGNVLEMQSRDGVTKSYLWGYQYQYPIAEFANISHATLKTLVNEETLHQVTDEQQLTTTLAALQDQVKPAMGKYYTYRPLVGVTSATDVNGRRTRYTYDSYGRLQVLKDDHGDIVKSYVYKNYIRKTSGLFAPNTVNTPIMGTYNFNCIEGGPSTENRVYEGGKTARHNITAANQAAEDIFFAYDENTAPPRDECPPLNSWTGIDLASGLSPLLPHPRSVFIDFIQDGHIVASRRFPNDLNPPNTLASFMLEAGTYKVSFRTPYDYYWDTLIKCEVTTNAGIPNFYLKQGDEITLKYDVIYNLKLWNE